MHALAVEMKPQQVSDALSALSLLQQLGFFFLIVIILFFSPEDDDSSLGFGVTWV